MRASAAGRTFTNRTLSAPWAARADHTSVVDAAGAIYVIGGDYQGEDTQYEDVWASTDGGTRAGLNQREYWVGTQGVPQRYLGGY